MLTSDQAEKAYLDYVDRDNNFRSDIKSVLEAEPGNKGDVFVDRNSGRIYKWSEAEDSVWFYVGSAVVEEGLQGGNNTNE